MENYVFVRFLILLFSANYYCLAGNSPIFSLQSCESGCRSTSDCPDNAACMPLFGGACGVCLCTMNFKPSGDKCVPTDDSPSTHTNDESMLAPSTDTTAAQSHTGTFPPLKPFNVVTNGNDATTKTPEPEYVDVSCDAKRKPCVNVKIPSGMSGDENSPMLIRSTKINDSECEEFAARTVEKCPNSPAPLLCAGGRCLEVAAGKSYCICPHNVQSVTCQHEKIGRCSSATGDLPKDGFISFGKKFVHKRDADNGAILTRHYAKSLRDCIKLCQWAGASQCGSVNYGTLNGKTVCELLSIKAQPDTALAAWITEVPNWAYACCFKN